MNYFKMDDEHNKNEQECKQQSIDGIFMAQ